MSLWDNARDEYESRHEHSGADAIDPEPTRQGAASASATITSRGTTVSVAGEDVPIEQPETSQSGDDGTWLTGTGAYGWPRGREAIQARQVVQTSAMQAITNGIVDQILGGELVFESDDDETDQAAAELEALLRDVLNGPHLMDDDLDDLMTAAVEDMMGPGNAYWQLLPAADGSLPVVSLVPLDALTIRHNVNRHGYPQDPPYYQTLHAFSSEGVSSLGGAEPVPLESEDVAVMRYPRGRRSHDFYPVSPSMQVLEWLEILANSTTHHNRFYADNEIPPGFIQIMNAGGNTIEDVEEKIQSAAGDPRSVEVIGGEGQAMWVEMGGTAVNLDVIQEQQWFFHLCLASLGLGKAELGLIEDVNRSNGEIEATRIYKRITGPFAKQFHGAFRHIAQQFDLYQALDQPFDIKLRFNDPREEHARQERLRTQYQAGLRTYNDFQEAIGRDPSELETVVEIGGELVDYGDLPKPVLEHKLRAERAETPEDQAEDQAEEAGLVEDGADDE